ncbi:hypothetical protein FRC04_002549 [Tulasnella sp. 424]|nr:hypothetical protein FRC04_002549 [Tulasnella sp. 424]KAG8967275.1 hypothetical protein FRC05_002121 [Tulasnella sp. 425]
MPSDGDSSAAESTDNSRQSSPQSTHESGSNQGSSSEWKAPKGYVKVNVDDSEQGKIFDYDTIKNDPNLEIWVMRMPLSVCVSITIPVFNLVRPTRGSPPNLLLLPVSRSALGTESATSRQIKPKHLENLTFQMPENPSSSSVAQSVGSINRKDKHYDVRLLPASSNVPAPPFGGQPDTEAVGWGEAEELKSLSVLLPRSKTNSLVLAPRPPARHILITQAAPLPTPTPPDQQLYTGPPPPRPQPLDKLVHVFRPIGSLAPTQSPSKQPQAFPMDIEQHPEDSDDAAEERPKKKGRKDGAQSGSRPEKPHSSKKKKHAQ